MPELTGDPETDKIILDNADEIQRLENLAKQKAAENAELIAKIKESRAKSRNS